jgi:hypothetical protein
LLRRHCRIIRHTEIAAEQRDDGGDEPSVCRNARLKKTMRIVSAVVIARAE